MPLKREQYEMSENNERGFWFHGSSQEEIAGTAPIVTDFGYVGETVDLARRFWDFVGV